MVSVPIWGRGGKGWKGTEKMEGAGAGGADRAAPALANLESFVARSLSWQTAVDF